MDQQAIQWPLLWEALLYDIIAITQVRDDGVLDHGSDMGEKKWPFPYKYRYIDRYGCAHTLIGFVGGLTMGYKTKKKVKKNNNFWVWETGATFTKMENTGDGTSLGKKSDFQFGAH